MCDGSPGIGCPVISSLSGSTLAVAVTEPTLSGKQDFLRVAGVAAQFRIPVAVIINRADLNPEAARDFEELCRRTGNTLLGSPQLPQRDLPSQRRTLPWRVRYGSCGTKSSP